jgi:hypothetical protein
VKETPRRPRPFLGPLRRSGRAWRGGLVTRLRRSLLSGAIVLTFAGVVFVLLGGDRPTAIAVLTLAIFLAVAFLLSGRHRY